MSDFLNFNIIDIGFLKRDSVSIATENKSCYVLSCRTKGSAIFNTENDVFNVNTGDIIYIPKGTSYSQKTDGEEVFFIHLEILGNTETEIQHIIPEDSDYICSLFCRMATKWIEKEKNYKYICTALLYELVANTCITLPKTKKGLLYPAIQYINEHFYISDFSLEKACQLSNISRVYFNRLFKKEMKTTPALYINKLKCEKAKLLLLSGVYTHNEIATLCGFSDTKYFYTVFKKITGITAGKYQKQK